MNIKDDPVYQDKLRKMHAVRRYLKTREKVYIARRDAGFNVRRRSVYGRGSVSTPATLRPTRTGSKRIMSGGWAKVSRLTSLQS